MSEIDMEAVERAKRVLDEFVEPNNWEQKGVRRIGNHLLLYKRSAFTLLHLESSQPYSLGGVIGGQYCLEALDAALLLNGAGLMTGEEYEAFSAWFWAEDRKGTEESEMTRVRETARKYGYEVKKK